MAEWIPHVYIMCNPHYEPERYRFLQDHLKARGIPLNKTHFVWTKWGKELSSKEFFAAYDPYNHKFGVKTNLSFQSAALSRGEVSLIVTFYEVIRQVLEHAHERVIVFESDVVLRPDFLPRLESVLKGLPGEGEGGWDYVSLSEGVGTRPKEVEPAATYFGPQKLFKPPHQWVFRCCDSNLFHLRFLKKVWGTLLPCRECLDWEMNLQMLVHKGVPLWTDPPLSEPATGRGRYATSLPT